MAKYRHKGTTTIHHLEKLPAKKINWGTVAGVTFWIVIAGAVLSHCAG